jgi:MFS superfamily sulfate permease-like transporter
MSWTTILTMGVLAVTSAVLVMVHGWEPWQAFAAMSGGTMLAVLVLLAIQLWFSSPQDRSDFLSEIAGEMRKELKAFFGMLRGK